MELKEEQELICKLYHAVKGCEDIFDEAFSNKLVNVSLERQLKEALAQILCFAQLASFESGLTMDQIKNWKYRNDW